MLWQKQENKKPQSTFVMQIVDNKISAATARKTKATINLCNMVSRKDKQKQKHHQAAVGWGNRNNNLSMHMGKSKTGECNAIFYGMMQEIKQMKSEHSEWITQLDDEIQDYI